jgi:antitoxin (DNA-binding transcriptional repressor) of toxin-antitoxin stability system
MKEVNLYEAKTHLSRMVVELEKGEDRIVICRNGAPVADLVRHKTRAPISTEPDPELAGARFLNDPCAPLAEADWPESLR